MLEIDDVILALEDVCQTRKHVDECLIANDLVR